MYERDESGVLSDDETALPDTPSFVAAPPATPATAPSTPSWIVSVSDRAKLLREQLRAFQASERVKAREIVCARIRSTQRVQAALASRRTHVDSAAPASDSVTLHSRKSVMDDDADVAVPYKVCAPFFECSGASAMCSLAFFCHVWRSYMLNIWHVQILFCSRTHSQLAQFVEELRKSPLGSGTRLITLGSRALTCINDEVR